MNLHFLPLNKYDCVIEHFDGSITIPPHDKKRYLYTCEYKNKIFILNNIEGFIFKYDIEKDTAIQVNTQNSSFWKDKIGISFYNNLFITYENKNQELIFLNSENFTQVYTKKINVPINSFTVYNNTIWGINREDAEVLQIDIESNKLIKKFSFNEIGNTSIVIKDKLIYITDSDENLLKVFNFNGELQFEAITPFIDPIGQFFYNHSHFILYSGLVNEVGYDNHCWQEQKPFFHEIKIHHEKKNNYLITSSNSFEVDFFYEENFFDDAIISEKLPLTIDLAIPPETNHQHVIDIQPIGHDFELIEANNIKFARFIINCQDVKAIGYKATLKLQSVKYNFIPEKDVSLLHDNLLSEKEMIDLDIQNPYFDQFIIKEKKSDIETVRYLRNLIYSKLYYKKNTKAFSFEEVLKDGYGTCGDYTSLIIILLDKNSISCQSAGGYKVPRFYNATSGIMSVYYNHAWIEIFNNKNEPIPVESSSDDKEYNGRFSEGQFLGIDWTHIKLYNGKAYPNLINIPAHHDLHPFDLLKKTGVFVIIKREL